MPRSELLPTINSISVYRSFSSGTCRRIASANSGRQKVLLPYFKQNILSFPDLDGKPYQEMAYGRFMRGCLDYYCAHEAADLATTLGLRPDAAFDVALYTLNPGQLETLTLLIMMDLGFIAEIGFANALPLIDYQGHFDETYATSIGVDKNKAVEMLSIIFPSIDLSKKNHWFSNDRIQIQCKNYVRNESDCVLWMDFNSLPRIIKLIESKQSQGLFRNTHFWLQNLSGKFLHRPRLEIAG